MTAITFRNHVIGRVDNPFLILDSGIEVHGPDHDTLRAHAADAMMKAITSDDKSGWPRGRWITFEIEGHQFKAKMHRNDIWVQTR
ncbi:hypothetical protein [Bradyrhizobium ottawaense]|uniref:Uncharacterized protein n=1 Tax=Bradyrhizobium ottawaense TaxID=931866 RepID=A0ABY0QHD3_9BRAD|nr:hypothetical protein [Bradyrhizobium ottawaense]SDK44334.1 hypothetical protein SAMN05444163_8124 [Bradyrhizobium ottawaense]